ncbi:MAG: sigma-70 family RNA polymerase sigma factor, partial [Pseudonocardiales bacterium]|nr:sigma-70 family RNA polymerase sigma factor [Pseudonocardiales bacterium]
VTRAGSGDEGAWNDLIERYAPLVWSICSSYRLSRSDIDDVAQCVWVLLVEKLNQIREPAALPGWLATTTHRECLRALRIARNHACTTQEPVQLTSPGASATLIEEQVIAAERDAALRAAFGDLPPSCQRLLSLLISDPPATYAQISAVLGMPIGSIGPNRSRCLQRLRRSPHLAAIIDTRTSLTDDADCIHPRGGGKAHA